MEKVKQLDYEICNPIIEGRAMQRRKQGRLQDSSPVKNIKDKHTGLGSNGGLIFGKLLIEYIWLARLT